MPRLSVTIIAKNEAAAIARCIEAVRELADDIVLVDSGSTDETVAIAANMGARTLVNPWPGYGPQKRFAEANALHDWVLNLDADEVVTPALAAEIKALMATEPAHAAYQFRVSTVYPGWSRPRLWADDYNIARLYDRRRVHYSDSPVHDRLVLGNTRVGQLQGTVYHYSYRSIAHMEEKLNAYTDLQAAVLKKRRWSLWLRLPFEYPVVFIRYYLLRRNVTGGLTGLLVSHAIAKARTRRVLKFLQARKPARKKHT